MAATLTSIAVLTDNGLRDASRFYGVEAASMLSGELSRLPNIDANNYFNPIAADISDEFQYAVANNNQYVPFITLKNGVKFEWYLDQSSVGYRTRVYGNVNGTRTLVLDTFSWGWGDASRPFLSMHVFFAVSSDDRYGICFAYLYHINSTNKDWFSISRNLNYGYDFFNTYMADQPLNVDDPFVTQPQDERPGGYGPGDYTSEVETPPALPSLSAAQVGFVSLWNPTTQEMRDLATYLWTGTFDLTNFKKLFTDPMECVLSVGIIPITPTRKQIAGVDTKEEIVFGGSSHSGVNAYPVTEQFYIVDMGSIRIGGQSQSAMDYSPYAKASIYLPYCGTYALDVDEIMDSDIELEYHIDIYTGACVAYLTINGHINSGGESVHAIMYQFTGNILASIPINGNDHSQFIQSMLFMGAAAAATVATGGAGAGAAAAGADLGAEVSATGFNKALAGSAINTVMSMKPNVQHSGNLSTTAGLLGGQKPFVTMTWSNLCRPEDEYKLVGMPLHKSGTLSDFEGFTIVSACHMDNILCTEAERALIEQALAKGVIL